MDSPDKVLVFGAAYGDVGEAMADYAEMKDLHRDGELGDYDAAIVTKEPSGMLIVSNSDAAGRFKSGSKGAVVGAVLGLVFPPSAIGMAALGAAAGGAMGQVKRHLKRSDMKELGELLQPGESGIILVTESVTDHAAKALFNRAIRAKALEVEADTEAIKAAVKNAAGQA
jgi:uncharacterized membrane protein